jgi:hypothetical protein
MSASSDAITLPRTPWDGGRRNMLVAGMIGVIGIVLWFVSLGFTAHERATYSWLWSYFFWLTPAVGAIGWVAAFYASKAKWWILPRRSLEVIGATIPVFVVLFIPVVVWMRDLYPWMRPESFDEEARRLFEHRHVWLNQGTFLFRAVLYFIIFLVTSELFLRWSTQQDGGGRPMNTARAWRFGPGSLPMLGFALTFAGFDWLMSLNVTMYSSMFGLYVVAGAIMAAMAAWILVAIAAGTPMSGHHMHSMGKLLFAFLCFWAYTAFAQFLLQWIADIPEETPWFHIRLWSDWIWVGWFLVVFHFALPFVILLSKRLKFSRARLSFMAVWLLVAHAVDVYWIVLPQLTGDGPHFNLSDLFAFVGIGGVAIAFLIFRLRGRMLVPVGDPFLANALEYHP